ncbi:hypothetical protein ADUPG1_009989, partial [Aduncisulcus paluster]
SGNAKDESDIEVIPIMHYSAADFEKTSTINSQDQLSQKKSVLNPKQKWKAMGSVSLSSASEAPSEENSKSDEDIIQSTSMVELKPRPKKKDHPLSSSVLPDVGREALDTSKVDGSVVEARPPPLMPSREVSISEHDLKESVEHGSVIELEEESADDENDAEHAAGIVRPLVTRPSIPNNYAYVGENRVTFKTVYDKIPNELGINIEIKYPSWEAGLYSKFRIDYFSRDYVLTKLISFVQERSLHGQSNDIVFSSFDPRIIFLLKLKQGLFHPIMHLTLAESVKWKKFIGNTHMLSTCADVPLLDTRCAILSNVIDYSIALDLDGVVCNVNTCLRNKWMVKRCHGFGLRVICYNVNRMHGAVQRELKKINVDGVIADALTVKPTTTEERPFSSRVNLDVEVEDKPLGIVDEDEEYSSKEYLDDDGGQPGTFSGPDGYWYFPLLLIIFSTAYSDKEEFVNVQNGIHSNIMQRNVKSDDRKLVLQAPQNRTLIVPQNLDFHLYEAVFSSVVSFSQEFVNVQNGIHSNIMQRNVKSDDRKLVLQAPQNRTLIVPQNLDFHLYEAVFSSVVSFSRMYDTQPIHPITGSNWFEMLLLEKTRRTKTKRNYILHSTSTEIDGISRSSLPSLVAADKMRHESLKFFESCSMTKHFQEYAFSYPCDDSPLKFTLFTSFDDRKRASCEEFFDSILTFAYVQTPITQSKESLFKRKIPNKKTPVEFSEDDCRSVKLARCSYMFKYECLFSCEVSTLQTLRGWYLLEADRYSNFIKSLHSSFNPDISSNYCDEFFSYVSTHYQPFSFVNDMSLFLLFNQHISLDPKNRIYSSILGILEQVKYNDYSWNSTLIPTDMTWLIEPMGILSLVLPIILSKISSCNVNIPHELWQMVGCCPEYVLRGILCSGIQLSSLYWNRTLSDETSGLNQLLSSVLKRTDGKTLCDISIRECDASYFIMLLARTLPKTKTYNVELTKCSICVDSLIGFILNGNQLSELSFNDVVFIGNPSYSGKLVSSMASDLDCIEGEPSRFDKLNNVILRQLCSMDDIFHGSSNHSKNAQEISKTYLFLNIQAHYNRNVAPILNFDHCETIDREIREDESVSRFVSLLSPKKDIPRSFVLHNLQIFGCSFSCCNAFLDFIDFLNWIVLRSCNLNSFGLRDIFMWDILPISDIITIMTPLMIQKVIRAFPDMLSKRFYHLSLCGLYPTDEFCDALLEWADSPNIHLVEIEMNDLYRLNYTSNILLPQSTLDHKRCMEVILGTKSICVKPDKDQVAFYKEKICLVEKDMIKTIEKLFSFFSKSFKRDDTALEEDEASYFMFFFEYNPGFDCVSRNCSLLRKFDEIMHHICSQMTYISLWESVQISVNALYVLTNNIIHARNLELCNIGFMPNLPSKSCYDILRMFYHAFESCPMLNIASLPFLIDDDLRAKLIDEFPSSPFIQE